MSKCPVCGTLGASCGTAAGYADVNTIDCPRCGHFLISGTVSVVLDGLNYQRAINNSNLSHDLRVHYDAQRKPPFLQRAEDLKPFQDDLRHMPPHEQLDNLILWLGNKQGAPHEWIKFNIHALAARIGTAIGSDQSELGLTWLINEFKSLDFYSFRREGGPEESYQLKPAGWIRFYELTRRITHSRNAFMAMKFGNETLRKMVTDWFQPAAKRAGFVLRPLYEKPSVGLIDDQIRVAIRTARFVIADLSDDNNGVYFEAGFAEGLPLPVIYTCEAAKFDARSTHFDTNHMHTVKWDADKPSEAANDLTATIRNTLPQEAKLDD